MQVMADLDGVIPLDVVVKVNELSDKARKEEYAKYRAELREKRLELLKQGTREDYEEYCNAVQYAKYEF